jgi:hypothetical protein
LGGVNFAGARGKGGVHPHLCAAVLLAEGGMMLSHKLG